MRPAGRRRLTHCVLLLVILFFIIPMNILAHETEPFPLGETGPYFTGWTTVTYIDESRQNREVHLTIMYPAVQQTDASGRQIKKNADPDHSSAPYPLILTGINDGTQINWQLPSHGFVLAYIGDSYPVSSYDHHLVDFPRDLVFALQQLAASPPDLLASVIDTDHAGVMGYSWDGYGALAVGGARADPEYYLAHCTDPALEKLGYPSWWNDYACALANEWETFVTNAGTALTTTDDGLWQPITDKRIRAIAPMSLEGALFFGPRGLAAVDRPTLIIAGTADVDNPYSQETVYVFEHLTTPDKTLISFAGQEHLMVLSEQSFRQMRHFVTAFFGFHLQGKEEYADFYNQAFVEQFDDLTWGVYNGD